MLKHPDFRCMPGWCQLIPAWSMMVFRMHQMGSMCITLTCSLRIQHYNGVLCMQPPEPA